MTTVRTKDDKRYIQRPFDTARVQPASVTVRLAAGVGPIARCVEILRAEIGEARARELLGEGS